MPHVNETPDIVERRRHGSADEELPSAIGVDTAPHHRRQRGILQERGRGRDIADRGGAVRSNGWEGDG